MTSSLTPTPLVVAVSFWLLVCIRHRYNRSRTNRSLLPTSALGTAQSPQGSRVLCTIGRYVEVDVVSTFILRGRSTLFVNNHANLLESLGRSTSESTSFPRRRPMRPARCCVLNWRDFFRMFYNLGSVTAIVGQALAVGVLWWSFLQLVLRLIGNPNTSPNTIIAHSIVKRNSVPVTQSITHTPHQFLLRPLIPGVNLPLSHLLPILVSLMVCTTIHELGHAIAAAVDGVPLISWGYYIVFIIPAAFVELAAPLSTSRDRAPLHRLRITSAGVYFNLITILAILSVSTISIGQTLSPSFGYRAIDTGVVVVDVQVSSPLHSHLAPRSIITRIDDVGLGKSSNHTPHDLWSSRLLLLDTIEYEKGWCVERHWFEDHSQHCCVRFSSHSANEHNQSCFITHPSSLTTSETGRCIDPVTLFEDQTKQRCLSQKHCNDASEHNVNTNSVTKAMKNEQMQKCVKPHSSAGLLRISFLKDAGDLKENIIVWKGPRREIWEQVTVGGYLPWLRILPVSLPTVVALLVGYLRTVSLCLFFFNLLPIRALDGGEILSAFLEYVLPVTRSSQSIALRRGDIDLEIGGGEWNNTSLLLRQTGRQIEALAEVTTVALVGIVFVGGILELGVG